MGTKSASIELTPNSTPLNDGTLNLQPGQSPSISIDFKEVRAIKRKDGWDFGVSERALRKYDMVELIQDRNSALYNTGGLLIKKMEEIKAEGQVYYWKIDPKHRYTKEQQEEYENRPQISFVRIGDGSNPTPANEKQTMGNFDKLKKWDGTTNCSTAVLDAVYRTLGGKVASDGTVISIGGVNGVPLTDESFSGFNYQFQGPTWADALERYGLGYKVELTELHRGDIIGTGGHRMVFLRAIPEGDAKPTKVSAMSANLSTGTIAIKVQQFNVESSWKLARLFDMKE